MDPQNQSFVSSQQNGVANQAPNVQSGMPSTPPPKSKSTIWAIVIVVVVILLAGGGYYYYQSNNKNMNTNQVPNTQGQDQNSATNNADINTTAPADQTANENPSTNSDISGIINAVQNMKDIVSKKDVEAFITAQSVFYKPGSSNLSDLKSQMEGKTAANLWQVYSDIYNNINFSTLEKDLASCEFHGGKAGYSFDQAASCQITLTIPKTEGNVDPLADGSTYTLKVLFARANNSWYMIAPIMTDLVSQ